MSKEFQSEFTGIAMTFWFGLINPYRLWTKIEQEEEDGGLQDTIGGI